jgi:hypothetical protein
MCICYVNGTSLLLNVNAEHIFIVIELFKWTFSHFCCFEAFVCFPPIVLETVDVCLGIGLCYSWNFIITYDIGNPQSL